MEWQGSNSGPGWQDVTDLMTALDSLHDCTTSVTLTSESWYGQPRLCASIVSMRPSLGQPDNLLSCTTVTHYPNNSHKTVPGWLFGELHTQDRRIGKNWYTQSEIPQGE